MFSVLKLSAEQRSLIDERIGSALREIGTLLLAFAPLDHTMNETASAWSLAGFVIAGGLLFAFSILEELRRRK